MCCISLKCELLFAFKSTANQISIYWAPTTWVQFLAFYEGTCPQLKLQDAKSFQNALFAAAAEPQEVWEEVALSSEEGLTSLSGNLGVLSFASTHHTLLKITCIIVCISHIYIIEISFIEINFVSLLRSHFPIPFIFCAIHSVYSAVNLSTGCYVVRVCVCVCVCVCVHAHARAHSVVSDSLWPHGL